MTDKIIDHDTYRSIKKMSTEEMNAFLLRYADNLSKDDSHTIDLSRRLNQSKELVRREPKR